MTESNGHLDRLDAYLDDLLTVDERATFEAELADNPRLRAALDLQRRIDDGLHRSTAVPGDTRLAALALKALAERRERSSRSWPWRTPLAVAAALAFLVTGAWLTWRGLGPTPPTPHYATGTRLPFETVYRSEVTDGFAPDVVCRDDAEFQSWFVTQFGQPLSLTGPPGGEAVGLSYAHVFSPWTIQLLARVDEQPVVVFIDLEGTPEPPDATIPASLHHHRRVIGHLVLHEVSPFTTPRVLPFFVDPREDRP